MKYLLLFLFPVLACADLVVFTDVNDAQAFRDQIDVDNGYPKAGVNIGRGIHATAEQSTTIHHTSVIQNSSTLEYAVNSDQLFTVGHLPGRATATITTDQVASNGWEDFTVINLSPSDFSIDADPISIGPSPLVRP